MVLHYGDCHRRYCRPPYHLRHRSVGSSTVDSFLFVEVNVRGQLNWPVSWGRNLFGSKIGIILMNIKQMFVYKFLGM